MAAPLMLVFDTETTGLTLHPDAELRLQPRMIEFGGVLLSMETGEIEDEFSQLIHPGCEVTPEITKITGITNEQLVGMPGIDRCLPMLRNAFGRATAVCAHNLPFDKAIVLTEMQRLRVTDFPWPARELCTVGAYTELWGKRPRLVDLYQEVMGKPLAQTHRALDDVKALVEIIHTERLWVAA